MSSLKDKNPRQLRNGSELIPGASTGSALVGGAYDRITAIYSVPSGAASSINMKQTLVKASSLKEDGKVLKYCISGFWRPTGTTADDLKMQFVGGGTSHIIFSASTSNFSSKEVFIEIAFIRYGTATQKIRVSYTLGTTNVGVLFFDETIDMTADFTTSLIYVAAQTRPSSPACFVLNEYTVEYV